LGNGDLVVMSEQWELANYKPDKTLSSASTISGGAIREASVRGGEIDTVG